MAEQTPPQGKVETTATANPKPEYANRLADRGAAVGDIATYVPAATDKEGNASNQNLGSLASTLKPAGAGGLINVLKNYRWQISLAQDDEMPYVQLNEYKMSESLIRKQLDQFTGGGKDGKGAAAELKGTILGNRGNRGILSTYESIINKSTPTGFVYVFPHISKKGFEISTQWKDIGDVGEAISNLPGAGEILGSVAKFVGTGAKLLGAMEGGITAGVQDRPKIFETHSERSIQISFVLFNTVTVEDYKKNKALAQLLMSQNLFNKRDYVTGIPPVFYDILIPGQYYSFASYVSDLKIENLGNIRMIDGEITPDAFQFDITLTEMLKPSKNQFEAIFNGDAVNRVEVSTRT